MPFDFKKYNAKCATLDPEALQREWEHYTRLISGAATSTAVSGMAIPFTLGVSSIGVGLAAPAIHNARKKREIIEKHLQSHGKTHHTRKRDVALAGAISGTVGVVTLGLAPVGADAICNAAAEHSIAYIAENELAVKVATHLALDAAAVAAEETHMHSKKEHEAWKAYAQAVKEGKNPPLPNSDLKIPPATDYQAQGNNYYAKDPSFQSAPSIYVTPSSDQKTFQETGHTYFPPPPGEEDGKPKRSPYIRHSISAVSLNPQQPHPQPTGHMIYGTTTAITTPIVGGQSYGIQLPNRPSSALGRKMSTLYDPSKQQSTLSPTSSYLGYPGDEKVQQYQPDFQRPRAQSVASFDPPPQYEAPQQPQPQYSSTQLYIPPPPPGPPPSSRPASAMGTPYSPPYSTPTPVPASDYFTPTTQYNPNRQANWNHQQQTNFHGVAQLVYNPQEYSYPQTDQKHSMVYQNEVQSPGTPYYGVASQQQYQTNQAWNAQTYQAPYFPPPPVA